MRPRLIFIAVFAWFLTPGAPRADVAAAAPSAFLITAETEVAVAPDRAWRALLALPRWWNGEHTYSGDARRLRLEPRAGGCWCERWDGGSVEHGRVILVMEHEGVRTLRMSAPLGPLQERGVAGVLTFTVTPRPDGAKIAMQYRVSGDAALGLDQLAPLVDMVLMEQFGRLSRYVASGSPD